MSYGTEGTFASKRAFAEYVQVNGAEAVRVVDTSLWATEKIVTVASLAGTSAIIVGPDVRTDRRWYASVKRSKDGSIKIV